MWSIRKDFKLRCASLPAKVDAFKLHDSLNKSYGQIQNVLREWIIYFIMQSKVMFEFSLLHSIRDSNLKYFSTW